MTLHEGIIEFIVPNRWSDTTTIAKNQQQEMQKKFKEADPHGFERARIRAEEAERMKKGRIAPLEQENAELKKKLAAHNIEVPGKKPPVDEPGFFAKAAKTAGEYLPYAAAAGLGYYAFKKLADRNKQQAPAQYPTAGGGGY